jgi:hypothetical protein
MAFAFEHPAQHEAGVPVVFDDEDAPARDILPVHNL